MDDSQRNLARGTGPGEIVARYLRAGDAGEEDTVTALLDPAVVTHAPGDHPVRGIPDTIATWRSARSGLSDLVHRPVAVLERGDHVAVRVRVTGRHTGPFLGIPATGAEVAVDQALFVRCREGKIVEMWEIVDTGSGLTQLGALTGQDLSPR